MSYRIDGGEWDDIRFTQATDQRNYARDGSADVRFLAWVHVGAVELERGQREVEFRMESANHHHGAIDAYTFTQEEFTPVGTRRPGEAGASEAQPEGSWAFRFPGDTFEDTAWLDLRSLNEEQSGQHGFIRLSEDGNSFVRGDGQPIRFWSVVSGTFSKHSPEEMDNQTRFLAKMGVNMVRLHLTVPGLRKGQEITDVNKGMIDKVFRYIKACKDAGIYVTISPFWYFVAKANEAWAEALPGYKVGDSVAGALFFNPVLQDAYKEWVRYLFTEVNPYTGLALKDDPTLAIIQVKNEDSLLFWTSQRIPGPQVEILARQYYHWLEAKHGSIQAAYNAWDNVKVGGGGGSMGKIGDDPENGIMGLYIIWELTQETSGGKARRLADQLQFFTETMRNFYADVISFVRDELGAPQLYNTMNWKTASQDKLDDAERFSNTPGEVIATNRYFGGVHTGNKSGYRVDPGHYIYNRTVLLEPLRMPTNLRQVAGSPMLITESKWVRPNLYQSEGPFLTASYMSLTGVDSLYWVSHSEEFYEEDPRRLFNRVRPGDTGYALTKWSMATPAQFGMFPANALMFRLGYIAEGEPAVEEHRSLEQIYARETPIITESESFDPNRDAEDLTLRDGPDTDVSRLAFLVGPVRVHYGSDSALTRVSDLSPYIDADSSTVRSNTDEMSLNWETGLFTLRAPKAKGVSGFLRKAGGDFDLDGVRIRSNNEYATIQLVSMDQQPLAESVRVLVQVGTTNRLTGWKTRPAEVKVGGETLEGEEILATGKPPFQMANTEATITITNPGLTKATQLDPAGYPEKELKVEVANGSLTVTLPPDTMYVVFH
jgi:hypothetical protein